MSYIRPMNLLTTQDAADRLGVTTGRVRILILTGRLPAEKFGRAHMIREEDLKLVEDRKPGRPTKQTEQTNTTAKPAKRARKKKSK